MPCAITCWLSNPKWGEPKWPSIRSASRDKGGLNPAAPQELAVLCVVPTDQMMLETLSWPTCQGRRVKFDVSSSTGSV